MSLLGTRVTSITVAILVGLGALAWWNTVGQSHSMSAMVTGLAQVGHREPNDMSAIVFLTMWVVMMVAMMFPTIAPVVLAHRMVVRKRGEGALPTVTFVGGYLAVWTFIGVVPLAAFFGFRHLSGATAQSRWVPTVGGFVLAIAGAYQFTRWKMLCLKACRSPMTFLMTHDFRKGARGAFRAGLSHGAYCLGCCWALMLVLVVVGLMNIVWMAAIALVFLAEKNWKHGVTLTKFAGVALLVFGLAVVVSPGILARAGGSGGTSMPAGDHMGDMK